MLINVFSREIILTLVCIVYFIIFRFFIGRCELMSYIKFCGIVFLVWVYEINIWIKGLNIGKYLVGNLIVFEGLKIGFLYCYVKI